MTLAVWFWIFMALWFFFGIWRSWPEPYNIGNHFLYFILFILLGWQVFGSPVK